jgi:hypothetical protein
MLLIDQGRRWLGLLQEKVDTTIEQPRIYGKIARVARYWNRVVSTGEYFEGNVALDQIKLPGTG